MCRFSGMRVNRRSSSPLAAPGCRSSRCAAQGRGRRGVGDDAMHEREPGGVLEMSAGADLGAVFDEHVASEFETKDINATMATMVPEPYVWHVPVLTGASGGEAVREFY